MRDRQQITRRHYRLTRFCIQATLMAALCLTGMQSPLARTRPEPRTHTILIKRFTFVPEALTVNEGDTIVWKNEDKAPHSATAEARTFDSKRISTGDSWTYVANTTGTHPYICTYHPRMKATLTVR